MGDTNPKHGVVLIDNCCKGKSQFSTIVWPLRLINITVQGHTFRRMKEQLNFLMVKNKKEKSTQNWQGSGDESGESRRGNKYEQNTLHESLKE